MFLHADALRREACANVLHADALRRKAEKPLFTLYAAARTAVEAHVMKTYGFPKAEHLCLRRDIERLFADGHSAATAWPLRAVWRVDDKPRNGAAVKVLLSVAKRRLRRAVDRNRAKRQLREAYRLNKHILWEQVPPDACLHVAFVWLAPRNVASADVAAAMRRLLSNHHLATT